MQRSTMWLAAGMVAGILLVRPAVGQDAAGKQETEFVGGLTLNDGNSENSMLSLGAATKGAYGQNEMKASAEYKYGESTVNNADGSSIDEKTADNAKGEAQYNRLLNERTYGFVSASLMRDDIADIDYRAVLGIGLGHYLIKSEASQLAFEIGPGELIEKVGGEKNDAVLLRIAQRAEHKFASGAKVWNAVEYLPEVEDFGTYLLNAEVGLDAAVAGNLSLRLVVQDRYDSDPAPDRETNDVSVMAGLVYKL